MKATTTHVTEEHLGKQIARTRHRYKEVTGKRMSQARAALEIGCRTNTVARWEREEMTPGGLYATVAAGWVESTNRALDRMEG